MKIIILGCGGRGHTYARYFQDHGLQIASVADFNEERLAAFGREYRLAPEQLYTDWRKAISETEAVALINATPDRAHYETTMVALERGLHVLLEKPMSPKESECRDMVALAERKGLTLMVCHCLRYAPFFEKIKDIIDANDIGQITNIVLTENVAYWHYAHSYVRGIFRREDQSSPFILAKSCHDLDMLCYLTGKRCLSVMSEGELHHFRKKNAPKGAPGHCLDGCPHETSCPYFAPRLYMKAVSYVGWPVNVISVDTSYDARYQALKTGPYGRCVFQCDNDVCDRQSALFKMEDGIVATFTMTGFASENTRTLRIFGTQGDIRGHLDKGLIEVNTFLDNQQRQEAINVETLISSHGGGDTRLLGDFAAALRGGGKEVKTSAHISLQSHLMAFAAERSRKEGIRVAIQP